MPLSSRLVGGLNSRSLEILAGVMVAHDIRRKFLELDKVIGLTTQIVRDHRR